MQVLSLNVWGGHVHKPLLKFITHQQHVDIFCFQEIYHDAQEKISTDYLTLNLNLFAELTHLLPHHQGYFCPIVNNVYGIAIFINKDFSVLNHGSLCIYHNPDYVGHGPMHSRYLQWLEFTDNTQTYHVINVHGLWNGQGKKDSPERIAQAKAIKIFCDSLTTPKILCGDFNLRPDTQSIQMIEQGMLNLIDLYEITSTRTSFYTKPEKFADYIFVSPELQVNHFTVLADEVSDHAPLLLDVS